MSAAWVTWCAHGVRYAGLIAQVLYILTVVTTVFIPAQFLTGLYGMNFAVMPGLTWEYVSWDCRRRGAPLCD